MTILSSSIHWYTNLGGLHAAYQVAETYLEEGEIGTAQSFMSGLSSQYAYAHKYPEHHNAYVQMFNLKILLDQEDRSWQDLSTTEIQELETLAIEDKGEASVQAQNILRFFYNQTFEIPLFMPTENASERLAYNPNQILVKPYAELKAYPNPAKEYVTFEYHYPEDAVGVQIVIIDITGKKVQQFELVNPQGKLLWDTREIGQGSYFYTLRSKDGKLKTGKISIIK